MSKTRQTLQQNSDGRWFTVVDYSVPRKYPRVYLGTTEERVAVRRLAALETTGDTDEAKRRVRYLAQARDEAEERQRIAEFVGTPKLIPKWSRAEQVEALNELLRPYGVAPDDRQISEWFDILREPDEDQRCKDAIHKLVSFAVILDSRAGIDFKSQWWGRVVDAHEKRLNPEWIKENPYAKYQALEDLHGIHPDTFPFFHQVAEAERAKEKTKPSKTKLSDCLKVWREFKEKTSPQHIKHYSKVWELFIDCVGDLSVNMLQKSHFVQYEKHILKIKGERSNKWYQDQFTPVVAILKLARRKLDEGDFPVGLTDWLDFDKGPKHTVAATNRQPMPVKVFQALLDKADEWADLDVDEYVRNAKPRGSNEGLSKAANKKVAHSLKRSGSLWALALRLCCNAGLDPIDLCRLTWGGLKTDKGLPMLDFPRRKMEAKTGPIDRKTPLLPATVKALQRWRELRQSEPNAQPQYAELVFTNDAKRPFVSIHLARGFDRLREALKDNLGNGWSLKHLRNVGPTLGKRAKRHPDERDAFLGHAVRGTSRFYEGDVDETYLTELVDLIGAEYFGGERVSPHGLRVHGQQGA